MRGFRRDPLLVDGSATSEIHRKQAATPILAPHKRKERAMPPILPTLSLHHRNTDIGALHAVICDVFRGSM